MNQELAYKIYIYMYTCFRLLFYAERGKTQLKQIPKYHRKVH
jgi:hypothetical protein